jgi:two-component system sensor histidine kinase KdpD
MPILGKTGGETTTWPARGKRWLRAEGWRYAVSVAIVAASCLIADILATRLGITRISVVFLAAVVLVASWHGAYIGVFAALLAFAGYNFFLTEPRFTFQFAGAEDVLTLTVFLAVALATGVLAGRVRDEGRRSRARAVTTAALFQASRELSAAADEDLLRATLAARIASAADGEACIVYGARHWSAPADAQPPEAEIKAFAAAALEDDRLGGGSRQGRGGWRGRRLLADGEDLGMALWRTKPRSGDQRPDDTLIPVLADLGASAIARARLGAQKSEIEALARTERLRAALLSSISHDFRTPLSSILASVSSLREFGDQFPKATRDDLLSTIEEETERLNRFVVNLLNMTKLEAGSLETHADSVDMGDISAGVEARLLRVLGGRRLTSLFPDGPVNAAADAVLLEQALANVVDNAIRYSARGADVTLTARQVDNAAVLDVEDHGPGVPDEECERIFEKFFRRGVNAAQPGTGLGLSITRGLVEAMGGTVEAGARRDAQAGLRVTLTLPLWTG